VEDIPKPPAILVKEAVGVKNANLMLTKPLPFYNPRQSMSE
jgi:hypothetical protein